MVRNMAIGVIFLGLTIVVWAIVDFRNRCIQQRLKIERRKRAYDILMRKKARQDALRKQKEDEAWALYVLEMNQEMQDELGDDRQTG